MQPNRISRAAPIFVALTLLAVALPLAAQETPLKIGVVDLDRLVAQSAMGQELQGRLEAFQQQVQNEMEALGARAQETRRRISEGAAALSDERLAELQSQYEGETIAVRRLQDDKQREGQQIQQEGLREIEAALDPIFKQLRTEGGYDLILNNVPGVVVLATERVDITAIVVERFNTATAPGAE